MAETPGNKTPASKSTRPSLSDLVGKNEDKEKNKPSATSAKSTSVAEKEDTQKANDEKNEKDPAENPKTEPVTMDEVQSALSDGGSKGPSPEDEDETEEAPGDGIIKEKDADNDGDEVLDRRNTALQDVGVLSRVHKLSPPGSVHLNTYSGGSQIVDHGTTEVIVKPLSDTVIKRERTIVDETGKSRLLHPEITNPAVPSEQAMVQTTGSVHHYAIPYDPDQDPNR